MYELIQLIVSNHSLPELEWNIFKYLRHNSALCIQLALKRFETFESEYDLRFYCYSSVSGNRGWRIHTFVSWILNKNCDEREERIEAIKSALMAKERKRLVDSIFNDMWIKDSRIDSRYQLKSPPMLPSRASQVVHRVLPPPVRDRQNRALNR